MNGNLEYDRSQELKPYFNPGQVEHGRNQSYKKAVESIEQLASILKGNLLRQVQDLDTVPEIGLGDNNGLSGEKVQGVILERSKGNMMSPDAIILVPNEGIVRVPWAISYRYSAANWEERVEVSAQEYIEYSPPALLSINRLKQEETAPRTVDLVQISAAATPR